jgi:glutamyl-Q tRNA(Asp) synthetase
VTERLYRGRFAPTPSGPLHFGSLVAAVGSYLDAKSNSGLWHLRIDDLDPPRVVAGATSAIVHCLESFGFEWDGPIIYQSQRQPAYHAAVHRLSHLGVIYPCACSRKEIAEAGGPGIEGTIYPGTCRGGLAAAKHARALRLDVSAATVEFEDGVLGMQCFDLAREAGDYVLYRVDGVYAFHLASAVDDGELAVSHVVRGGDLLESSARQIHLLGLLGLPVPCYIHLPVAIDASGQKLSKQTHATAIDPAHPVPALCAVLRFLNQPVPASLERASLQDIWSHALANWRLHLIGTARQAHGPQQPFATRAPS